MHRAEQTRVCMQLAEPGHQRKTATSDLGNSRDRTGFPGTPPSLTARGLFFPTWAVSLQLLPALTLREGGSWPFL